MSQNIVTLLAVLITALSTLSGVLITSLFNSRNARIAKQADEAKHYRNLLFRTAVDYWQAERKEFGPYLPLEKYIVSMDAFYTVFMEENPDDEKVQKKMAAGQTFLVKEAEFFEQQKQSYLKRHGQSKDAM